MTASFSHSSHSDRAIYSHSDLEPHSDQQQVSESSPSAPIGGGGRRRKRAEQRRARSIRGGVNDAEHATLAVAADARGLALATFVIGAALAEAENRPAPQPKTLRQVQQREASLELAASRMQLVRIGTLLNQLAKVANSTGQVPAALPILLRRVEDAIDASDQACARVFRWRAAS